MDGARVTALCFSPAWALACLVGCAETRTAAEIDAMARYQELAGTEWRQVLHDGCTGNWRDAWFLDGRKATVTNGPNGMTFTAGPAAGDDSCHAVLWTKRSFRGDLKIEYEYTRTDSAVRYVTILYIQATGSGDAEHRKDIAAWSDLRTVPSMRLYFNHMNTYHISYAAFGTRNDDPGGDYIRARRYMPDAGKGLAGTELKDEYARTGLFKTGVPYRITVIKSGQELFMHIQGDGREQVCHFRNVALPPIVEGRIGLRHMYTRGARYRDFRVSVPAKPQETMESSSGKN
jgi:hypothetical protein